MKKIASYFKNRFSDILTKRGWLLLTTILFLSGLSLGTWAYYLYPTYGLMDSFYASIRLFTLNVEIPVDRNYSWQLETSRWISAFVVVSSIIGTVGLVFRQELKLLLLQLPFQKDHYIIAGLSEGAYYLALDLREKKEKVVIIEKDTDNEYIEELRRKGCTVVIGDAGDRTILSQVPLTRASGFIVYTNYDSTNVDIVMSMMEEIKSEAKTREEVKVKGYIHLNHQHFVKIIEETMQSTHFPEIDIISFNIYELGARLLFDEKPIYNNLDILKPEAKRGHLLILGFGKGGKHVALEAIKRSHFPNLKQLKITVIDQEAEKRESEFFAEYPYVKEVCELEFIACNVKTVSFRKAMEERLESITYIVTCFDNDELDYLVSSLLTEDFNHVPLAVRLSKVSHMAEKINQNQTTFLQSFHFGKMSEISNKKYIIQEDLEKTAIAIHEVYARDKAAWNHLEYKEWVDLSRFMKDSNLAQADHLDTKLHAIGLSRIEKNHPAEGLNEDEFREFLEPWKEWLAIAEHNRWNAFHFANGWQPWESNLSMRKDEKRKRHACLVNWEQLDKVSADRSMIEEIKCDYKKNDRDYINDLYQIVESSGYKLIRQEGEA